MRLLYNVFVLLYFTTFMPMYGDTIAPRWVNARHIWKESNRASGIEKIRLRRKKIITDLLKKDITNDIADDPIGTTDNINTRMRTDTDFPFKSMVSDYLLPKVVSQNKTVENITNPVHEFKISKPIDQPNNTDQLKNETNNKSIINNKLNITNATEECVGRCENMKTEASTVSLNSTDKLNLANLLEKKQVYLLTDPSDVVRKAAHNTDDNSANDDNGIDDDEDQKRSNKGKEHSKQQNAKNKNKYRVWVLNNKNRNPDDDSSDENNPGHWVPGPNQEPGGSGEESRFTQPGQKINIYNKDKAGTNNRQKVGTIFINPIPPWQPIPTQKPGQGPSLWPPLSQSHPPKWPAPPPWTLPNTRSSWSPGSGPQPGGNASLSWFPSTAPDGRPGSPAWMPINPPPPWRPGTGQQPGGYAQSAWPPGSGQQPGGNAQSSWPPGSGQQPGGNAQSSWPPGSGQQPGGNAQSSWPPGSGQQPGGNAQSSWPPGSGQQPSGNAQLSWPPGSGQQPGGNAQSSWPPGSGQQPSGNAQLSWPPGSGQQPGGNAQSSWPPGSGQQPSGNAQLSWPPGSGQQPGGNAQSSWPLGPGQQPSGNAQLSWPPGSGQQPGGNAQSSWPPGSGQQPSGNAQLSWPPGSGQQPGGNVQSSWPPGSGQQLGGNAQSSWPPGSGQQPGGNAQSSWPPGSGQQPGGNAQSSWPPGSGQQPGGNAQSSWPPGPGQQPSGNAQSSWPPPQWPPNPTPQSLRSQWQTPTSPTNLTAPPPTWPPAPLPTVPPTPIWPPAPPGYIVLRENQTLDSSNNSNKITVNNTEQVKYKNLQINIHIHNDNEHEDSKEDHSIIAVKKYPKQAMKIKISHREDWNDDDRSREQGSKKEKNVKRFSTTRRPAIDINRPKERKTFNDDNSEKRKSIFDSKFLNISKYHALPKSIQINNLIKGQLDNKKYNDIQDDPSRDDKNSKENDSPEEDDYPETSDNKDEPHDWNNYDAVKKYFFTNPVVDPHNYKGFTAYSAYGHTANGTNISNKRVHRKKKSESERFARKLRHFLNYLKRSKDKLNGTDAEVNAMLQKNINELYNVINNIENKKEDSIIKMRDSEKIIQYLEKIPLLINSSVAILNQLSKKVNEIEVKVNTPNNINDKLKALAVPKNPTTTTTPKPKEIITTTSPSTVPSVTVNQSPLLHPKVEVYPNGVPYYNYYPVPLMKPNLNGQDPYFISGLTPNKNVPLAYNKQAFRRPRLVMFSNPGESPQNMLKASYNYDNRNNLRNFRILQSLQSPILTSQGLTRFNPKVQLDYYQPHSRSPKSALQRYPLSPVNMNFARPPYSQVMQNRQLFPTMNNNQQRNMRYPQAQFPLRPGLPPNQVPQIKYNRPIQLEQPPIPQRQNAPFYPQNVSPTLYPTNRTQVFAYPQQQKQFYPQESYEQKNINKNNYLVPSVPSADMQFFNDYPRPNYYRESQRPDMENIDKYTDSLHTGPKLHGPPNPFNYRLRRDESNISETNVDMVEENIKHIKEYLKLHENQEITPEMLKELNSNPYVELVPCNKTKESPEDEDVFSNKESESNIEYVTEISVIEHVNNEETENTTKVEENLVSENEVGLVYDNTTEIIK